MLKLRQQSFDSNLIQGPMAGISTSSFRKSIHSFGGAAFCYTEMISAKTILAQNKTFKRYCHIDEDEGPVCFQLSGNDPTELYHAVQIAESCGADLFDLNCGCPMPKIRKKLCGSAHLKNLHHLEDCIDAMRRATDKPLSIKVRVDGNSSDCINKSLIDLINATGLDFCVVHGRHWQENYDSAPHYSQISEFASHITIPVVGNGDVHDFKSLMTMQSCGVDAVMISRASVGQPWLFHNLQHSKKIIATNDLVMHTLHTHLTDLAKLLGSEVQAIQHGCKFIPYYLRNLNIRNVNRDFTSRHTNLIGLFSEIEQLVHHHGIT